MMAVRAPGSRFARPLLGVGQRADRRSVRLRDAEPAQECFEPLPVLGDVDRFLRTADDRARRASVSGSARLIAVWPPNWTIDRRHPVAAAGLVLEYFVDTLGIERLEVEAVGGVEVGRDGLRIGVDHDRVEAGVVNAWAACTEQ